MEAELNFKSQICTSREQSERLLSLGLKKETADMKWLGCSDENGDIYHLLSDVPHHFRSTDIPAWSLHRLLCLYGADYEIKEVYNNAEECYGMLICAIEIAIENGDFNEEYLER